MIEADTGIRSATVADEPQAVAALVAAFITDPMLRFAWPSPHDYLACMPRFAGEFVGPSVAHGAAYLSEDNGAAALWLPPGVHPDGEALGKLFLDTTEASHRDDLFETFERIARSRPEEPHWYLPLVGVEPNAQGRGIGDALMRRANARCDREGALAYLESSNPRNVPFYERCGFEALGQIQVGAGPLVTPMQRRPSGGRA